MKRVAHVLVLACQDFSVTAKNLLLIFVEKLYSHEVEIEMTFDCGGIVIDSADEMTLLDV